MRWICGAGDEGSGVWRCRGELRAAADQQVTGVRLRAADHDVIGCPGLAALS